MAEKAAKEKVRKRHQEPTFSAPAARARGRLLAHLDARRRRTPDDCVLAITSSLSSRSQGLKVEIFVALRGIQPLPRKSHFVVVSGAAARCCAM